MVGLARKNNPPTKFEIRDTRKIHCITDKFDGIVCGFCIPYLSQSDCLKLITDCKNSLYDSGIPYLSFVTGDYENSGFISGSSDYRTYLYYHNLEYVEKELEANSFETIELLYKKYKRADGTEENHTVVI